jgi:hypothetical protein
VGLVGELWPSRGNVAIRAVILAEVGDGTEVGVVSEVVSGFEVVPGIEGIDVADARVGIEGVVMARFGVDERRDRPQVGSVDVGDFGDVHDDSCAVRRTLLAATGRVVQMSCTRSNGTAKAGGGHPGIPPS